MKDLLPELEDILNGQRSRWLITGVAGFIGSSLLEALLTLGQDVVGLDNFFSGKRENLDQVRERLGSQLWSHFEFIEGDIRNRGVCLRACERVERVLHQAALGSVPRSLEDPFTCHEINVTGFLNVMTAARETGVRRVVYASSSAVYGDDPGLPKREESIGRPLSPYAASKWMNEIYAGVFARAYGFSSVGLRYFNVYGPRQDPEGAYAAVIPKWVSALLGRQPVQINGDGETSRDFCFIQDVVQANLRAATASGLNPNDNVFNVASGERTTLNELFALLQRELSSRDASLAEVEPRYRDFRAGDIRHSLADISSVQKALGYQPKFRLSDGLAAAFDWYCEKLG